MSEFAGDLPDRRQSKMDKIAVNAFIHGGALSDPIELNSHLPRQLQSTMLPASPHSASLHMKIYPARNGSVIIVDYTSTSFRK